MNRIRTLDGWRGIAILLVLAEHAGWERFEHHLWAGLGSLGVDIFFVLSGYIITVRLLQEREATSTISLSSFYIRRAFRILPVVGCYLASFVLFPFSPVLTFILLRLPPRCCSFATISTPPIQRASTRRSSGPYRSKNTSIYFGHCSCFASANGAAYGSRELALVFAECGAISTSPIPPVWSGDGYQGIRPDCARCEPTHDWMDCSLDARLPSS